MSIEKRIDSAEAQTAEEEEAMWRINTILKILELERLEREAEHTKGAR